VAARLNVPLAIIDKRRINDTQVEQNFVVGEVYDRDAIIVEDEIATGTTLVHTINTLHAAGAGRIIAGATHPILCGNAVENLSNSPLEELIVTNTCRIPENKRFPKLTVLSVAALLSEAMRRIHTGESVGALFT
jgi:ribose-phosphate pyrophosphokinase